MQAIPTGMSLCHIPGSLAPIRDVDTPQQAAVKIFLD
jgi:hypothetical protein